MYLNCIIIYYIYYNNNYHLLNDSILTIYLNIFTYNCTQVFICIFYKESLKSPKIHYFTSIKYL